MSDDHLYMIPITRTEARDFIALHHRHHAPPPVCIFQIAVARGNTVVGVAMVGNPMARLLCDGWTLEVTRLCTIDSPQAKHAASKLYAACWRIAREMGYQRLITYTLKTEAGISLDGAGWRCIGESGGGTWNRRSRPRLERNIERKTLWEVTA